MTPTIFDTPNFGLALPQAPQLSKVGPRIKAVIAAAFEIVFDSVAIVARVQRSQRLLAEAERCERTDPARATRAREVAARLASR